VAFRIWRFSSLTASVRSVSVELQEIPAWLPVHDFLVNHLIIKLCQNQIGFMDLGGVDLEEILIENNEVRSFTYLQRTDYTLPSELVGGVDYDYAFASRPSWGARLQIH
jgi:hypothetical protein